MALCASQAFAQACTSLPANSIGPAGIVGQGPNGEKAASVDAVKLTDAEAAKVKSSKFKVGISMQTMNLDWSQLQVKGITDTLTQYGVEVIGTASAEYQVDKQIADIENTIQRHPDGIISIPVDGTATAATYKKVSAAGIKLVFMDNVPTGLKHPEQYSAMVSADSEGNGHIKIKQVAFTDPSKVGQIAGDFLTANPDVKGVFAVWDQPALDTLTSMRAQGINTPVTTVDLGLESAIEIAKGGPLKATGSQRPYDQGVAEAMAMMKALLGQTPPAWIGVQSLPVVQSNVLESYKTVFKKDPPPQLADACKKAGPACG
jgi:ribose transport system substrate-binding protein